MMVKGFELCGWQRSGGVIKEQQQNFKGIWPLKLQEDLQRKSGPIAVPAPGRACWHTHFAACTHHRD